MVRLGDLVRGPQEILKQQKPQSDGKSPQKKPGQPDDPHFGSDQPGQGKTPNPQQAGQLGPDGSRQQQGSGPMGRQNDPSRDPRQNEKQADKQTDK